MILFANIAYTEMRGFVMGACETIAGITRCIVLLPYFKPSLMYRVLFFVPRFTVGPANKNLMA